jgi:hypothetical protein
VQNRVDTDFLLRLVTGSRTGGGFVATTRKSWGFFPFDDFFFVPTTTKARGVTVDCLLIYICLKYLCL